MPSDLIFCVSNAAADARELKSAASFIFKADAKLIAKVISSCVSAGRPHIT